MSFFRTPTTPRFCAVCGGPPDNHYPDCPVLTGQPVQGFLGQAEQSQLVSQDQLLLLNQKLEAAHKRLDLLIESIDVLGKLIKVQGQRIDKLEDKLP